MSKSKFCFDLQRHKDFIKVLQVQSVSTGLCKGFIRFNNSIIVIIITIIRTRMRIRFRRDEDGRCFWPFRCSMLEFPAEEARKEAGIADSERWSYCEGRKYVRISYQGWW